MDKNQNHQSQFNNLTNGKTMEAESYLMETDRKKPTLTQDMYDINEETIPRRKNFQRQEGYLGEIAFQSKMGEKCFRLYNDSSLGMGLGCQSILIDQEWDEDIETDYSCAENAVQKCIKQLSQAMRHQKKGMDPTRPFIHDYSTVEQRFHKENQILLNEQKAKNKFLNEKDQPRLTDSPLIQSRSRIFSQMQNMMSQLEIQSNFINQQQQHQDNKISRQETTLDFAIQPFNTSNDSNSYHSSQDYQGFGQTNNTYKDGSQFDPYFYERVSAQNSQQSQYRFLPDYPSISQSNGNVLSQQTQI